MEEMSHYWHERFFTSEHVKRDLPVEGGSEYATMLYNLGVKIVYLTGRDGPMRQGTIDSLLENHFPYGDSDKVICSQRRGVFPMLSTKK